MTSDGSGEPLTPVQVRVLGCLVEKESTTPASYPLSVNALQSACNQSTSRDPVMDVAAREVEAALLVLRDLRLARPVRGVGDRVTKFRHAVPETWSLSGDQVAVLSVLMLRGPQTVGEARTRTTRQHDFADVAEVGEALAALATREPPLVVQLPRGHGQKEARWTHLVGGPPSLADRGGSDGPGIDRPAGGDVVAATGDSSTDPALAAWLAGAAAVAAAVADPAVAAAWDQASVLEAQTVGSLAGHLARGGVWVVGDYLDGAAPTGPPDLVGADEYFEVVADQLDEMANRAIRERGATVAAPGPVVVVDRLRSAIGTLRERLADADLDRLVAVYGGLSITLRDYLVTRIVEQAVHLDDLVRSVDGLVVAVPSAVSAIAERTGIEVLRRQQGPAAPVRVLFRGEFTGWLPVL